LKNYLLTAAFLGAAPLVAPAMAQKSKDTLRFSILDGESVLDQYLSPGAFHYTWGPAVYDSLVGFDPKKGEFLPVLAKSWSQPNPTKYVSKVFPKSAVKLLIPFVSKILGRSASAARRE
jgi:ABC-type transport system substrate-binding protein